MLTHHLRVAFFSAVAASVATVAGVALYAAAEEPQAFMVGAGLGASLAPYGALLALIAGYLLGLLQPRINRAPFVTTAIAVAAALGGGLGWWVSSRSYILFQPISAFLASTWAIAAFVLSTLSRRSPNTSLERMRDE